MYKQNQYKIIDAKTFQEFLKSKVKNCKTVRDYYDKLEKIFSDNNVFAINHVKNKFYLRDLRDTSRTENTCNPSFCLSINFCKRDGYDWNGCSENMWWILFSDDAINWNWKWGVLKKHLTAVRAVTPNKQCKK
jgi:hypothetical protein